LICKTSRFFPRETLTQVPEFVRKNHEIYIFMARGIVTTYIVDLSGLQ